MSKKTRILALLLAVMMLVCAMPLYLFAIDEESSEAAAVPEETSDKQIVLSPTETAYVQNGDKENSVMTGDLLVGGGYDSQYSTDGKVYVKLSVKNVSGSRIYFGFATSEGDIGCLNIYGISDAELAKGWSSADITYTNAPANDPETAEVDLTKVFDGAPIQTIDVNGAQDYAVDITNYALTMQAQGAEYITLVFAVSSGISKSFTFADSANTPSCAQGGGLPTGGAGFGITTEQGHNEAGAYYITPASQEYERMRMDIIGYLSLTEADIGRTFRVTYWAKSTKAQMSFINCLMANRCSCTDIQRVYQYIYNADEWQKIVYEFTITDEVVNHVDVSGSTTTAAPAGRLDFEGIDVGATLYIDDLTVEETTDLSVHITPKSDVEVPVYISGIDFDSATSAPGGLYITGGCDSNTTQTISNDNAMGTAGQSLQIYFNQDYNRFKFKNTFGKTLDEEDIGRTFTISFSVKADKAGSFLYGVTSQYPRNNELPETYTKDDVEYVLINEDGTINEDNLKTIQQYFIYTDETPDAKDYSTTLYPSSNTATITEAQVGQWLTFEFDVTIDATMLAKTVWSKWNNAWTEDAISYFSIFSTGSSKGMTINIDDITVIDADNTYVPSASYYMSQDIEDVTSISTIYQGGGGLEMAKLTADDTSAVYIDKAELSTEYNHTENGTKSIKLTSHKNWNRFKILTLWDIDTADLGDKFEVSFWWTSSNKTGTLNVGLMGVGGTYNAKLFGDATGYKISTIGEWQKCTYTFTVTQEMIDNKIEGLHLSPSFGQNYSKDSDSVITSADPVYLYLDDFTCTKVLDTEILTVDDGVSASVFGTDTENLVVSAENETGIKKTYLTYAGGAYETATKATLELIVKAASTQTLKIYALNAPAALEGITFATAPAYAYNEDVDMFSVFMGAPIAEITVDAPGTYEIDVTDFVKAKASLGYTFVIVSEDASGTIEIGTDGSAIIANEANVVIDAATTVNVEMDTSAMVGLGGYSTTLGELLGINFYASNIPENVAKAVITVAEVEDEIAASDFAKQNDGTYKISSKVSSIQARENISIAFYNDADEQMVIFTDSSAAYSYNTSVYEYANELISDPAQTENVKDAAEALLNYAAYAEKYFCKLESIDSAYSAESLEKVSSVDSALITGTVYGDSDKLGNVKLVLNNATKIRIYLNDAAVVTSENADVVYVENDGEYYIDICGIDAKNLDTVYELKIDTDYTVKISVLGVASVVAGDSDTYGNDFVNLMKALYLYSVACEKLA